MSKDIVIKKGLNINLKGAAEQHKENAIKSNFFTITPEDFHQITPKLIVKKGAKVKAGEPVFFNKTNPNMKFVSPVSGEILEISRGEKRRILGIKIQADQEQKYVEHGVFDLEKADASQLQEHLLQAGCWPFIKQRPYDVIANPENTPKSIFISGYASAPLAADLDFTLQGKESYIQTAITALSKLTSGKVHIGVAKKGNSPLATMQDAEIHLVSGPHPAGNVGTLINKIDPVNKGEVVWTVNAQDLVIIGELLETGKFNAERVVALVGSLVKKPRYFVTKLGAEIASLIYDKGVDKNENFRIISGNVLTGKTVQPDGFLDYYNNTVTILPEGNDYEFFGWNKPVFNKVSITRALTFSWLNPTKKYDLNTNTNGEHRAFVMTGMYEQVFPLDMYPLQMLKSCLYKDLDEMEAFGMYEVAPEDFALTEFVCVSKQPHQKIIREGLDLMLKEIG